MDKKRGIWLIGLSLGILFFCMVVVSAKIDDPVLHYKFDENTWVANVWENNPNSVQWNLNDARVINYGSDSRLNGYASSGIAPISESAGHGVAVFNKGIVRVRNFVDLGTGDLSISFWVQAISTSEMQSNGVSSTTSSAFKQMSVLLSNTDVDTNNKGYGIFVSYNAFYIKVSNGVASKYMSVGLSDISKWNHIVFVISRTGQSKVYVNGQVQNNIDTDITSGVFPGEDISYVSGKASPANSLYIGTNLISQSNFFKGAIDDLRIYRHSLTQNDVTDLFNTEKSESEKQINNIILNNRFCSASGATSWSTDFTPASTTNKIKVRLLGGGGSGAVATCNPCTGYTTSGGGGGGGYTEKTFTQTSGQVYTTIVSCGAQSQDNLNSDGINAQESSFFIKASGKTSASTSDLRATGGSGGKLYAGVGGDGGSGFNGDSQLTGNTGESTYGDGGLSGGQTSSDCRFYPYEVRCQEGYQENVLVNKIVGGGVIRDYYASGFVPGNGGGGAPELDLIGGSTAASSGAGASGQITAIEYSTTAQTTPPTTACTDDQTLFRLFANTNSHVSPYSDTNAPVRICYKDIFGSDYAVPAGTNPHTCSATNKIMGISTATNAHAESPGLANYPAKICYGNLVCALRDNTCSAGESAVASLSSNTNAHIALGTDTSYTKKICCKTGGATGMGVEHRQIYFTDTTLNFAYAPATGNTVSWIIDEPDGTKITENQKSFTKSFASAGQRTITIAEKDANGVIKAESQISILIINAVNGVLAFINKPGHKQYISSDELKIKYEATDSYVIKLETRPNENACSGRTITCLAGDCPTETKNAPAGCTNKFPVGGPKGADNYGNTEFNWMFNGPNQRVQGTGNTFATGTQGYSQKGEYRIDLTMKYSANNINIQSLLFQRVFTLGIEGCKNGICSQCSADGQWLIYLKTDKTEESRRPTSTSLTEPAACAGSDELIGTKDDCCPTGQECKPAQNGAPAGCYPSNYKSCGDYTTKELCEAGPGKAWETDDTRWNTGGLGKKCGDNWADGLCMYNVVCEKCRWVAEATGNIKKCQLEGKNRPSSGNPLICNPSKPTSVCTYTSTASTSCESGFKSVDIDATPQDGTFNLVGVDNCVDRTVTIPCGRSVLDLPFFEGWQIVGAIIIILVIYYLIIKKTMHNRRSSFGCSRNLTFLDISKKKKHK